MNLLVVVDGNAEREAWVTLAAERGHAVACSAPGELVTPAEAAGYPLIIAGGETGSAAAAFCRALEGPGGGVPTVLAVAADDACALAMVEAGASHVVPAGAGGAARRAALEAAVRTADLAQRAREAEVRVNDLVEDANDLIYTHDLRGVITSGNRAAESITGYPLAELIGTNISSLVAPEHLARAQEMTRRKVAGDADRTAYDLDLVRKDGTRVPLEVSTRIIFKDGRAAGVQGIGRDISERKRHEDALRASEQRFSRLFARSPEPLALAAAEDCTLVDVNERMLGLLGYRRDEFVGSTAKALRLWEEEGLPERVLAHLAKAGAIDRWEVRARAKDGTLLTTLFSAERVQFSGEDFVFFTISDISERKRQEEAIARLAAIVDASDDAIFLLGTDGSVLLTNPGASALYGYSAEELAAGGLGLIAVGGPPDVGQDLHRQATAGQPVEDVELPRETKDGRIVHVTLSVFPVRDTRGEVIATAGISRDITGRKEAEARTARQLAELRILFDLSLALAGADSLDTMLEAGVDALVAAFDSPRASARFADPGTGELRFRLRRGLSNSYWPAIRPVPEGGPGRSLEPTIAADVAQSEGYWKEAMLAEGIRAVVALPIWVSGQRMGYLTIYEDAPRDWLPREVEFARTIAGTVGLAIHRLQVEAALRESEARTRLVIDTALDAVITIDTAGTITAWNARAEAIFGWPAGEAIGRELAATIIRPGDRESHRNGLGHFLQTGEQNVLGRRREVIAMRRDGSDFPAELAVTPIVSASGETSFSAFIRDITERRRAEQALRVSEAKYRAVIDGTSDAIFVLDRDDAGDFRCVLVNRAFEELTRLRGPAIIGRTAREALPAGNAEWAESRYALAAGAGGTVEYEESFRLGRREVHLITTLTPVYDEGGSCRRIIGSSHDVTARKAAEDALRASEINYRTIFDNISDGLYVMERGGDGQFRCTTINDAYCDLLDRTPEMVLGKTLKESLGTEAAGVQRRFDQAIAAGGPIQWEWSRDDISGQVRHAITQLTPLFDAAGSCYRLIGSLREVTGLRRAEEAQGRAEALANRLGRLLDESSSEVYVLEAETLRFLQANRGARDNLGYGDEELRSMTAPEINPGFSAEGWARFIAPLFAGERETVHVETTVGRKDGTTYVADLSLSLSRTETPPVFLAVVQDITERRRQEEALLQAQKLESLGVLAGGIAHDFNNLLVGILGNAGLALMELPPASPARETIQQIETAGRHAADLARQMLAYSGKGRFVIQPVDVNSLVEEMTHLLRASINKGVSLHYDLAANLPPVEADITQLRQVVMNLVVNASDAIGQESGIITIATEVVHATREDLAAAYLAPDLPAGDYVSFSIRDTGAGMDADTRAKIFDPFFTTKFTGRGLGLAAVLGIVRGHHGAIQIDSTPGRGSAFTLLLPCTAASAEPAPGPAAPAAEWEPTGSILVVDDEDTVRRVTARALSSLGLTVLTASDGFEALEAFREHHAEIRCTLLDMTMPGMDGEQTFRALREIDPATRVVLMSGFTQQDATGRFTADGLAGFIQKPYEVATLREVIRQVIETAC